MHENTENIDVAYS